MSQTTKKIYTVEITDKGRNNCWYWEKTGHQFEAELKSRDSFERVGFFVGGNKFINPIHCKVVSETLIPI